MTISLSATKRETGPGASKKADGSTIPAVVYGPKQEALSIAVPLKDFEKTLSRAGESSVIELAGATSEPLQVLIHEVDRDPVTNAPRHADFYAIEKGAKVEVAVPLSFVGESPAVKAGASLVKVLYELPIEASPADLPHEIEVDLSSLLAVGDQIHVANLKIPTGVSLQIETDQVVALVQEVQEEEEAAAPAPDMASIEVEKKGKTEEEASSE